MTLRAVFARVRLGLDQWLPASCDCPRSWRWGQFRHSGSRVPPASSTKLVMQVRESTAMPAVALLTSPYLNHRPIWILSQWIVPGLGVGLQQQSIPQSTTSLTEPSSVSQHSPCGTGRRGHPWSILFYTGAPPCPSAGRRATLLGCAHRGIDGRRQAPCTPRLAHMPHLIVATCLYKFRRK